MDRRAFRRMQRRFFLAQAKHTAHPVLVCSQPAAHCTFNEGHDLLGVHLGFRIAPITASQYRKGMLADSVSCKCSSFLRVATAPRIENTPDRPSILIELAAAGAVGCCEKTLQERKTCQTRLVANGYLLHDAGLLCDGFYALTTMKTRIQQRNGDEE